MSNEYGSLGVLNLREFVDPFASNAEKFTVEQAGQPLGLRVQFRVAHAIAAGVQGNDLVKVAAMEIDEGIGPQGDFLKDRMGDLLADGPVRISGELPVHVQRIEGVEERRPVVEAGNIHHGDHEQRTPELPRIYLSTKTHAGDHASILAAMGPRGDAEHRSGLRHGRR